jgi:hydroxymethylpyrimidine/phosphomethylpyrimidine kinase
VEKGHGSYIDGIRIKGIQRTKFDEIYGELPERDDILRRLTENLAHLESNTEISSLIPAVGMNMVYSRPRARSLNEVAGVSGKVIVSSGKPKVCGNVSYGGSKHVALALLEAMKLNPRIRAAINIAGTGEALEALESVGIKICHVPSTEMGECPIATFIKDSGTYYQAYYHPGAFAIEPSVVLFSKTPEGLLRTLTRVAKHVRDKKGL